MTEGPRKKPDASTSRRRLFFALWPPAELQAVLHRAGRRALGTAHGRRIGPERLHLTLAFLGSITEEMQRCCERAAASVRCGSFELILDRSGCFRHNGILWLGSSAVPLSLRELVHSLNAELSACGFVPETRPYRAHVTLARDVDRCPDELAIEPIVWKVDEFALIESRADASGAHYDRLMSWPLVAPPRT